MTSPPDRVSGLRYVAVANSLRQQILHGTYLPGERLPRQRDLATANGVSYVTLKAALDILEREGYLLRKVGEGTYASLPKEHPPVALVVDDDPEFREFLVAALETSTWEGVAAESGQVALEKLGQQPFDMVFLDLLMPDMNGAETFREIRKMLPDMEVAIVTAYPDSALMHEALRVGPFTVIEKPFSLEPLHLILTRVQSSRGGVGAEPGWGLQPSGVAASK